MNNLIKFFNAAPVTGKKVAEETIIPFGAQRGFLVHPDCCTEDVYNFLKAQEFNPNSTFYKKWSDITEKDRFELFIDQIRHYTDVYVLGKTEREEIYCPNGEPININYKSYIVIRPVTEKEMFDMCVECLTAGAALAKETLDSIVGFVVDRVKKNHFPLDLDAIANRDALCMISDQCGIFPVRGENIIRILYYRVFGNPMPIQGHMQLNQLLGSRNGRVAPCADVSKIDLTKLTDEQMAELSRVFLRYKKFMLGLKKNKKNAPVINKLRRMAVKNHRPMVKGFWENLTNLEWSEVEKRMDAEVAKLDNNFKITRLIQMLTMRKYQNIAKTMRMYVIRNGKVWTDRNAIASYNRNWDHVIERLVDRLIDNMQAKLKEKWPTGCYVKFPERLSLACPVSEKKYLGNVPFGSTYDLSGTNNYFGVYWRGEWGTQDFDLHFLNDNGDRLGWNAGYYNEGQSIVFSGDMTTARPEATEMFYAKGQVQLPDGNLQLCRYNGEENSKFRLFFGQDNIPNITKNYMVDPNTIQFAEMGVSSSREQFVGRIQDQKLYVGVMDLSNAQVARSYKDRNVAFKIMCSSYIPLKDILLAAGYIEYNQKFAEDGIEPTLDLTNLQKNTLLDLFGN